MNPILLTRLARAVRAATSIPPEKSYQWLTTRLVPELERHGLTVVDAEQWQRIQRQHYDLLREGAS